MATRPSNTTRSWPVTRSWSGTPSSAASHSWTSSTSRSRPPPIGRSSRTTACIPAGSSTARWVERIRAGRRGACIALVARVTSLALRRFAAASISAAASSQLLGRSAPATRRGSSPSARRRSSGRPGRTRGATRPPGRIRPSRRPPGRARCGHPCPARPARGAAGRRRSRRVALHGVGPVALAPHGRVADGDPEGRRPVRRSILEQVRSVRPAGRPRAGR